jgi:choice-of-anchor B domain-containing protein
VRHALVLVTLILATAQIGTGQSPGSPEPPLAGHCDCTGGVCPIGANKRACSCGCGQTADTQPVQSLKALAFQECRGGRSGIYPCSEVDLLSFLPLAEIGGGHGNDVWGWTDPDTGREYALVGRTTGTAFVDVTDPSNARYLGDLPTQTVESIWRNVKVYGDYAFVVSEAPNHGMQVFDLRQLRGVEGTPVRFESNAHYSGFGSAHNVAIDTASGFAYAVGTRTCAGGLHVVNVQDPLNPRTAGCYAADGYSHDTQCIVYDGPDRQHIGEEICFASNEDTLTIVDASDKQAQRLVSRTGYDTSAYTHQGWLTDDRRFFLVDDEGDEKAFRRNTRTFVWDVSDLEAPFIVHIYEGPVESIDHNLFIRGNLAYESNYRSGLRVLEIGDLSAGGLREIGFFDLYPADNAPEFNGAWSVYPFFQSGTVLMNGIEQGLFVVRPRRAAAGMRGGIGVSIVATNRPAVVNGELVYVARVVNYGPDRATGVQLTTQLPSSATIVSTTSSRGSCGASSIVTCQLGSLAAGGEANVTIRVRPTATADLVATARLSADPMADDNSDNVATSQVAVQTPRRELALLYPNGGETLPLNRLAAVQWTLRGVGGGVRIEYSGDDGRWTRLMEGDANFGFWDWVPGVVMPRARVRVTSLADPTLTATSAGTFTIR